MVELEQKELEPENSHQALEIENPIFEKDGRYWKVVKPGTEERKEQIDEISSFVIDPQETLWIHETDTQVIRCKIQSGNKVFDCSLEKSDFDSRSRLLRALPDYNLTWLGSDKDTQYLMNLLAREDIPSKTGTTMLGYHDDLWVIGNNGIDKEGWVEDPEIIFHPRGGTPVIEENLDYRRLSDQEYQELVKGIYENLPFINRPEVIYSNIGWTFATPFKPLIMNEIGHFPIKNVYGTTGAGKSSTELLLWQILGGKPMSRLLSCKQTEFDFVYLLSSTSSIPLLFNEYKFGKLQPIEVERVKHYATCAYDGKTQYRGRPELSLVEFTLSAPMAIIGEVPLTESALLERIVPVNPSRNTLRNDSHREHFNTLLEFPLNGFIDRYIQHVYQVDFEFQWSWVVGLSKTIMEDEGMRVPPRVADNMMVVAFGIVQFIDFGRKHGVDVGDYREIVSLVFREISRILAPKEMGERLNLAIDRFMEEIAVMIETEVMNSGVHYFINGNELYLNLPACYHAFKTHLRAEGSSSEEILDQKAYRDQFKELKEAGSYVTGIDESKWFGRKTKRAIVIDLDKLEETLRLDLRVEQAGCQG